VAGDEMKVKTLLLALLLASGAVGAALSDDISFPAINFICGIFSGIKLAGGAVASLVLVYSGLKWVGESDDPGARKNARDHMKWAIVGILVIIMADAMVLFVTNDPLTIQNCSFFCTFLTC
jgi:hypothetical protein